MSRTLSFRSLLPHLAAMLVVLLGAFVGQAYLHPVQAEIDLSTGLLVSTRHDFRVCLEVSEPARAVQVAETLTTALVSVQQHKDWEAAYHHAESAGLVQGCGVQLPAGLLERGEAIGPGITKTPSPYRTVIVVLDEVQAKATLGANRAMLVPFELMVVDEHVLSEVTSALVVREDFLQDPAFVDGYLTLAVGLEPGAALPTEQVDDPNAQKLTD